MNTYTHLPIPAKTEAAHQANARALFGDNPRISIVSDAAALQGQTDDLLATADELQSGNTDVAALCRDEMGPHGILTHWAKYLEQARAACSASRYYGGETEAEHQRWEARRASGV